MAAEQEKKNRITEMKAAGREDRAGSEQKQRAQYEAQRMRSVHLSILAITTVSVIGVTAVAIGMSWELWFLPFVLLATVVCWVLHIRQIVAERNRLILFMIVLWFIIVYHGVHDTSFYDLAAIAAIEFAIIAQTDERRFLYIGYALYLFCFLYGLMLQITGGTLELSILIVARILLHFLLTAAAFFVAQNIQIRRARDRESDELVIDELKKTRRYTEDFLVNVSHAFRTPVNVVQGLAGSLLVREMDEKNRRDITHIMEAGSYLTAQLDDLLDYTELETGRLHAEHEPYMIGSVLHDVLNGLGLYSRETQVQVVVDVDASIPLTIRGDARRIKKVLHHLMDNAIKYTNRGGVYVRIYPIREAYGFNLCMEVQDTGTGMTREQLSQIREGLYSAEHKHKSEGFGLGLQLVFGIVHEMEGFVRIDSEPGKGTQVHVSVPQEIVDETHCMSIEEPSRLKLAFYQQAAKFDVPMVREYYTRTIMNLPRAFHVKLDHVMTLPECMTMMSSADYTHLYIADEEYAEDPAYFDELAAILHVVVVARYAFEPSPGSRVTVLRKPLYAFPLVETLNAETEQAAKEALVPKEGARFDGKRALVVDDEEMNVVVGESVLAEYGIAAEGALTGEEAVEKARRNRYDVIFMDHMMPVMDGVQCAHRIRDILRSEGREVPIVALTANAVSGARELFIREGFDGFVAKPVNRAELERTLRRVLRGEA